MRPNDRWKRRLRNVARNYATKAAILRGGKRKIPSVTDTRACIGSTMTRKDGVAKPKCHTVEEPPGRP